MTDTKVFCGEETAMYFVKGQPYGVKVLHTVMAQCPKCTRWMTLPHGIQLDESGPTITGGGAHPDMVACGYSDCRALFEIKEGAGKVFGERE